ncbi:PfkB family carbohydrate kinase [candidate division KSB1 bacterium]
MDLLVVGSVALDSVQSPAGGVEDVLGGSAVFFSLAAGHYTKVGLVAVVGEDFPEEYIKLLENNRVDTSGLQVLPGKTFRWAGIYGKDPNERTTLKTELNLFADFKPALSKRERGCKLLFLANIDPKLQLDVLDQARNPRLVAMDTMNFWISGNREDLGKVLGRVDLLIINDSEARELTGKSNLIKAAEQVAELGPRWVVIKKGEHGAILVGDGLYFSVPAYPVRRVVDPTGAGDTFAGGLMGCLAESGRLDWESLRQGMVIGTVLASFACESFSVDRLVTVRLEEIEERYEALREYTRF